MTEDEDERKDEKEGRRETGTNNETPRSKFGSRKLNREGFLSRLCLDLDPPVKS